MIGSLSQQLFETLFAQSGGGPTLDAGSDTPPGEFLTALLAAAPETADLLRQRLLAQGGGEKEGLVQSALGGDPGPVEDVRALVAAVFGGGKVTSDAAAGTEGRPVQEDAVDDMARRAAASGIRPEAFGLQGDVDGPEEHGSSRALMPAAPEPARATAAFVGASEFEATTTRAPVDGLLSGDTRRAEPPTRKAAPAGMTGDLAVKNEELSPAQSPGSGDPRGVGREGIDSAYAETDRSGRDHAQAYRGSEVPARTEPALPQSGTPGLSAAASTPPAAPPLASDALSQGLPPEGRSRVVQDIEWLASRGGGNARVRLHPPELGEIQLAVRVRNGEVEITIRTQDERAFRTVAESRDMLIEGLAMRDLRTTQLNVTRLPGDDQATGRDGDPRQPGNTQDERTDSERREREGPSESRSRSRPALGEDLPRARAHEALRTLPDNPSRQAIDVRI